MMRKTSCPAPEIHLLGEIVAAFGNLELALESTIWELLAPQGDTERFIMAQAVTAEMAFGRKVHALASMFRQKKPSSTHLPRSCSRLSRNATSCYIQPGIIPTSSKVT